MVLRELRGGLHFAALLASVADRPDLDQRWRRAERSTDERFEEALAALTDVERAEFADRLIAL